MGRRERSVNIAKYVSEDDERALRIDARLAAIAILIREDILRRTFAGRTHIFYGNRPCITNILGEGEIF